MWCLPKHLSLIYCISTCLGAMNGTTISLYQLFKTVSFLLPIHLPMLLILNIYLNPCKSFKENLESCLFCSPTQGNTVPNRALRLTYFLGIIVSHCSSQLKEERRSLALAERSPANPVATGDWCGLRVFILLMWILVFQSQCDGFTPVSSSVPQLVTHFSPQWENLCIEIDSLINEGKRKEKTPN